MNQKYSRRHATSSATTFSSGTFGVFYSWDLELTSRNEKIFISLWLDRIHSIDVETLLKAACELYWSVLCPANILWSTESCARPKSKSPEVMEATHTAPIRYRWLTNMPLYQLEAQPLSLTATQRWVAGGLWSIHHGGFALIIFAQQPYIMIHFSMLAVGIFFFLPRSTQTSQHIVNRSTFYRPHPAAFPKDLQQKIVTVEELTSRSISESDTLLRAAHSTNHRTIFGKKRSKSSIVLEPKRPDYFIMPAFWANFGPTLK